MLVIARRTVGIGAVIFGLVAWYQFTHQLIGAGIVCSLLALTFLAWTVRRHDRDTAELERHHTRGTVIRWKLPPVSRCNDRRVLDSISSEGEQAVLELRANILEGVGRMDGNLGTVLALYLTSDRASLQMLERELLPRVNLGGLISALLKLLERNEDLDDYAYLTLMPKVVEVRNVLAHMAFDIFESTDETLVFTGWKKGQYQEHRLSMARLQSVDRATWDVSVDLRRLHERLLARFEGDHFDRDQPEDL